MNAKRVDDQLSDDEIARRMERGLRKALSTPPQPHGKNPRSPAPLRMRVRFDANELTAILSELSTEVAQCPPEIIQGALHASDTSLELVTLEVDMSAAAAAVLAIRLQPSDRLRGLVAAARARDIDRLIVKKSGHS